MKKILSLIMIIAMLSLTACGGEPEIVNLPENGEDGSQGFSETEQQGFEAVPEGADADGSATPADINGEGEAQNGQAPEGEPLHVVKPTDAYYMYGYVHFLCEQTGTYRFEVVGDRNLQWQVYILDSEFPDAERYIPQVYDMKLEGSGEISVNQGEYIYVYCNANSWTCLDAPENSAYNCYLVQ